MHGPHFGRKAASLRINNGLPFAARWPHFDLKTVHAPLMDGPPEDGGFYLVRSRDDNRELGLVWWNPTDDLPYVYEPETGAFHQAADFYLKDMVWAEPNSLIEIYVLDADTAAAIVSTGLPIWQERIKPLPKPIVARFQDPAAIPADQVLPALKADESSQAPPSEAVAQRSRGMFSEQAGAVDELIAERHAEARREEGS